MAVGLLLTLAIFFLAWSYATFPGDREALEQFQGNQSGWLDTAGVWAWTRLGWAPVSTALMVLTVVGLIVMRRWADSLVVALSGIPIGVGILLKDVIGRARPEYFLTNSVPSSLSFPSGHSLFAMLFGGLLIVLVEETARFDTNSPQLADGTGVANPRGGRVPSFTSACTGPATWWGGYLFGVVALLGLIWLRNRLTTSRRASALASI